MSYFNPLKITGLPISLALISLPAIAHNVEISGDVAATFHITPNHNPQVGQKTQAWFALTRRGGETIPLSDCNCLLNVYTVPRAADAKPLLQPSLSPIDVEKYQDIPGAEIVFPSVGSYELEITGTAKDNSSFSPFELSYTVNVRP